MGPSIEAIARFACLYIHGKHQRAPNIRLEADILSGFATVG